jgi:hypothetical protein
LLRQQGGEQGDFLPEEIRAAEEDHAKIADGRRTRFLIEMVESALSPDEDSVRQMPDVSQRRGQDSARDHAKRWNLRRICVEFASIQ